MIEKLTWSYSSIKTFDQCPKKYYHTRVAKDVVEPQGEAMIYGNKMHKAAELYIKNDTPLPGEFAYLQKTLDALNKIPGDKHCEVKLAVSYDGKDYAPTTFFAKDVWWRGVADLLIVDGDKAFSVDYKTGKNAKYADTEQLDLVAAGVFTKFPEVKHIKSALAFVVSNDFIKKEHQATLRKSYFATAEPKLERLVVAQETDVWNANPSGLCGWCPVKKCEHYRERR